MPRRRSIADRIQHLTPSRHSTAALGTMRRGSVMGALRTSLAMASTPASSSRPRYRRVGSVSLPISDLAATSELSYDSLALHMHGLRAGAEDNGGAPNGGDDSTSAHAIGAGATAAADDDEPGSGRTSGMGDGNGQCFGGDHAAGSSRRGGREAREEGAGDSTDDHASVQGQSGGSAGKVSVHVTFEMDAVGFAFPNPVAATAALAFTPGSLSDASRFEQGRDALIAFLLHSRAVKTLTILFVLGVATFIGFLLPLLPMQFGWARYGSLGHTAEAEQGYWNLVQQCLTALFSYQNALSLPWRAAVLHHLACSPRDVRPTAIAYTAIAAHRRTSPNIYSNPHTVCATRTGADTVVGAGYRAGGCVPRSSDMTLRHLTVCASRVLPLSSVALPFPKSQIHITRAPRRPSCDIDPLSCVPDRAMSVHLCAPCGVRRAGTQASDGRDFYGRPTEAMFFHIPRRFTRHATRARARAVRMVSVV